MRWSVFAIFALVFVVVQLSLRSALTLRSFGYLSPDLVASLAVFIALFAARSSALWACWMLGLALDLAPQAGGPGTHVIGPNALGYVFGGYVVLQLRTMVFRRRAITIGFLVLVFLLAASLVAVLLLSIRNWYDADGLLAHGALRELWVRLGSAVYSALIALLIGWLLNRTVSLWGFQSGQQRRGW